MFPLLSAFRVSFSACPLRIFPWVVTNHMSSRAPPLENAANVQEMLRFWYGVFPNDGSIMMTDRKDRHKLPPSPQLFFFGLFSHDIATCCRNYPVQEHLVRTRDNYLLGVHRITHGREKRSAKGVIPNPPENIVNLLRENGVPLAAETKEAFLNRDQRDKRDQEEDLEADFDQKIKKSLKTGDYIKPVVLLYHGFMMCSEVWLCNLDEERNLPFVLAEAG